MFPAACPLWGRLLFYACFSRFARAARSVVMRSYWVCVERISTAMRLAVPALTHPFAAVLYEEEERGLDGQGAMLVSMPATFFR